MNIQSNNQSNVNDIWMFDDAVLSSYQKSMTAMQTRLTFSIQLT